MFNVLLCNCSESKSKIQERILEILGTSTVQYLIQEVDSISEVVKGTYDFDLCFINQKLVPEAQTVMEYVEKKSGEKVKFCAFIENPITNDKCFEVIRDAVSQYLGYKSMSLSLEIMTDKGIKSLPIKKIQYFEFSDRKLKIKFDNSVYYANDTLKNVMEIVSNYGFYQPHKSVIVNLEYVDGIKNYSIFMKDGEELPLAQKKSKVFKKDFHDYVTTRGYSA
ncbi:MAG: LytTR family transcriptional regulator [Turicibacter sp.]|nr:LytTR family transcriptional regulator [Turicibacter sp.]